MSYISEHVGKKIRLLRKMKNMTLEDFSQKINKSVSTVSKYENGSIAIDIETLFYIADALDISINQLTDCSFKSDSSKKLFPKTTIFGSNENLYMYNYDGTSNKITKSLIRMSYDDLNNSFDATLYMDIDSITDFFNCKYLYLGKFFPSDTISSFSFVNQSNHIENLSICVINTLSTSKIMTGMISGIAGYPLLPAASKAVLSQEPIPIDEKLKEQLSISKEDIKICKKHNKFIVMRVN